MAGTCLFDVIIFDADNKDSTVGMSCPPAVFVEASILQKVRNLLTPRGTVCSLWTEFVFICCIFRKKVDNGVFL